MDTSELTKEQIIEWALNYAGYEELEVTAKALYSIYAGDRPKKSPKKKKDKRLPLGYRKYAPPLEPNRRVPYTEIRK